MKKFFIFYTIFIVGKLYILAITNDTEIKEAISYLNQLRKNAGLIELKEDKKLTKSSKNHLNYIILNNQNSHEEEKGKRGFTGKTPYERALFVGYPLSFVTENSTASSKANSAKEGVEELFRAIYHRLNFLNFYTEDIGAAGYHDKNYYYKNQYVFDMGVKRPKQPLNVAKTNPPIVVWPYKDYYNFNPAFFNVENPAPLSECPRGGSVGNPISVQFNPSKFDKSKFTLISFKLFKINGEEIKNIKILHQGNDPYIKKFDEKIYILFPMERLEWNRRYKVEIKYLYDGKEYQKEWSFKTKTLPYNIVTLQDRSKIYEVQAGETYAFYTKPKNCGDLEEIIVKSQGAWAKLLDTADFNTRYIKIGNDINKIIYLTTKSGKTFKVRVIKKKSGAYNFVKRVYLSILGREADKEGLIYWENQVKEKSASFVAHTFLKTKEFKNLNLSDKAYIAALYETLLNRTPDFNGLNYWNEFLKKNPHSRDLLFYKFVFSKEFENLCKSYKINPISKEEKIEAFIERFYIYALKREVDEGGLNFWKKELLSKRKSTANMAKFFLLSKEFKEKNLSKKEFILVLYKTFFDREPTQNELKYWSQRALKESEEKLINIFLYSKEFKNIAQKYEIKI